ncbi:hypothetical protein MJO28_014618 [Puccinia striiformis f. sp. tritici]|uniref:Uncharacterized protein n=1 Tax=Puccinia striiformis f. sp. tritici TaxID=168172 RepID=A0ACC0DW25_9BASI|nr:hypothetical protein MJO28_014618 [Puccinia striiformis f. sp. tritici]
MCAHLRSDPCTSFRAVDGISPVDLCKSFNSGGARRILLSGKKAREQQQDEFDLVKTTVMASRNLNKGTCNNEGEGYIEINSTKYHKLRKTHPIATNTYSA